MFYVAWIEHLALRFQINAFWWFLPTKLNLWMIFERSNFISCQIWHHKLWNFGPFALKTIFLWFLRVLSRHWKIFLNAIQRHGLGSLFSLNLACQSCLHKCFNQIKELEFSKDDKITAMKSFSGESLLFVSCFHLQFIFAVCDWMIMMF